MYIRYIHIAVVGYCNINKERLEVIEQLTFYHETFGFCQKNERHESYMNRSLSLGDMVVLAGCW